MQLNTLFTCVLLFGITLVSCDMFFPNVGGGKPDPNEEYTTIEQIIYHPDDTVSAGDTLRITVSISDSTDPGFYYSWSVSVYFLGTTDTNYIQFPITDSSKTGRITGSVAAVNDDREGEAPDARIIFYVMESDTTS